MSRETINTIDMTADMAAVVRHQRNVTALQEEASIRTELIRLGWTPPGTELIRLGWTPPGAEVVTLTSTTRPSTLSEAVELLQNWYRANDDLFTQCASNPVTNAWGKEVDMTKLNDANRKTQAFLRSIGELPK